MVFQLVSSQSLDSRQVLISAFFSVFEYTYLLFWNSFWTIAPVIALGVFDRMIGEYLPSHFVPALSNCMSLKTITLLCKCRNFIISDERVNGLE